MTTTGAFWCVIACDLVYLYPFFHQYLVKHDKWRSSPGINHLFEDLILEPISILGDVPYEKLLVIVIDALDECGGLRHNLPIKNNYKSLLDTLKHWIQMDHLKRFKLVITSRLEDAITKMFPDSVSIHVNIPSGSEVKLEDSASDDICVFLKSQLDTMGMEPAWIARALDYLVSCATCIFIWATTAAKFLQINPQE